MKIIENLKKRLELIKKILSRPNEIPSLVELAFDLDGLQKPDYPKKVL